MKKSSIMGTASAFVVAAMLSVSVTSTSADAAIIDLGFALDNSNSISEANFGTVRTALAAALGVIPTSGANTYRISVVKFNTTASTVVTRTINNATDLAFVQAAVGGLSNSTTGSTCVSCATSLLTSNFAGLGGLGNTSLMNVFTDGEPNVGQTNGTTLRNSLVGAGWDSISAEAVGNFDLSFLQALVSPNPGFVTNNPAALPNPLTQGFVLTVANFSGYSAAIQSKVQKIVDNTPVVPVPAALPLLLTGLAGLGALARRRKQKAGAAA